ncbi:hypothetical protein F5Y15DRAFT_396361 [Xylariaceae sp. FL0016]|nr:hypothetical protein F5Y15DRAFT_396361 [Xylariaceae sp. FL0016]
MCQQVLALAAQYPIIAIPVLALSSEQIIIIITTQAYHHNRIMEVRIWPTQYVLCPMPFDTSISPLLVPCLLRRVNVHNWSLLQRVLCTSSLGQAIILGITLERPMRNSYNPEAAINLRP